MLILDVLRSRDLVGQKASVKSWGRGLLDMPLEEHPGKTSQVAGLNMVDALLLYKLSGRSGSLVLASPPRMS